MGGSLWKEGRGVSKVSVHDSDIPLILGAAGVLPDPHASQSSLCATLACAHSPQPLRDDLAAEDYWSTGAPWLLPFYPVKSPYLGRGWLRATTVDQCHLGMLAMLM